MVPRRASTITHTPQTMSCSDMMGAGATAARTSFHTQHTLAQCVLATEVTQLSDLLPVMGEGTLSSHQPSPAPGLPVGPAAAPALLWRLQSPPAPDPSLLTSSSHIPDRGYGRSSRHTCTVGISPQTIAVEHTEAHRWQSTSTGGEKWQHTNAFRQILLCSLPSQQCFNKI